MNRLIPLLLLAACATPPLVEAQPTTPPIGYVQLCTHDLWNPLCAPADKAINPTQTLDDIHHRMLDLYVPDAMGHENRWHDHASEVERGEKFTGDCEEFATTTAHVLVDAGYAPKDIRIAFVRAGAEDHLVTLVDTPEGAMSMDNLSDSVWPARQYNYTWIKTMRLSEVGTWRDAR